MTWKVLALTALAAGCGARIGDGVGNSEVVDGGNGGGGGGGGGGTTMMDAGTSSTTPDAANAACPNGRRVYLNFDGVTLTRATTSDARTNQASWLTNTSAAIPPWHQGSGTRATDIQTIVSGVKSRLAMTPIEIVTQRPATGTYVMVAFGGQRTSDGGTVGTPYSLATNEHDCGDGVKADVGWVSDIASVSYAQDLAVGAIGWGLGLNGTNSPTDCMCGWANDCDSAAGACTLSASIATTSSQSPATTCPNQNPQNEVAAFSTKFCQ